MKLLSGILGLTLTSAVALASANAADLYRGPAGGGLKDGPYIPVATWTGFYIGVNGGYAFGASDKDVTLLTPGGAYYDTVPGASPHGGFGGGQIGYNWQGFYHPNLVFGIEADIQGAGIEDSYHYTSLKGATGTSRGKESTDYFGTVRGRLGYAFERTLIYATGGFAYGDASYNLYDVAHPLVYKGDGGTRTGYVVGGGLEYKLTPAWSVKAEYQYINLGTQNLTDVVVPGYTARDAEVDFHTVRLGLNYSVGHGYEPLK
jgi:outer membrane immunogenic protein